MKTSDLALILRKMGLVSLAVILLASPAYSATSTGSTTRKPPAKVTVPKTGATTPPVSTSPPTKNPGHGGGTGPTGPTAGDGGGTITDGSILIDSCFSPNGNCDQKLIQFIGNAKTSLDIAIYSMTHTGISQAIVEAKNRGINVRMVVDRSQSKGTSSQVSALQSAGVPLVIGNFAGIMHDKFTIVDGAFLETGSYNYSANATSQNAENQLYINDANLIQRYVENFNQMFQNGSAQ